MRILVAEDHEELREIIVAVLRSEFEVIAAVGDGEQLVREALFFQPDVIVSDVYMPLMDGLSARKELLSKSKEYPFVFISMFEKFENLPSGVDEGPVGYVHKLDLFSELKLAVHAVALGRSYLSASIQ